MGKVSEFKKLVKKASFWQKFNLAMTFFWLAMIPVSFSTGLAEQTSFVTLISLIALVLAAQSSWQSSRNEVKEDIRDPDTPDDEV